MPDDLYDRDCLIWSEQQAGLLRRLADGERVNDAIDWANVIEEIEDVGRAQLGGCQSLLLQALVHMLKLRRGEDRPAAHWRMETGLFLADAQARYTPSMRQRIDLGRLYAKAVRLVRTGEPVAKGKESVPGECPFTLDELLADDVDVTALVDRLRAAP
jgi:hypothetical protein